MKKIYKTMRGRIFDMEKFSNQNGNTRAIGNTNMNGRGDILGKLNEVAITREQIETHPNRLKLQPTKQVSLKQALIADDITETAPVKTQKRGDSQFDTPKEVSHRESKKSRLK